MTTELYPTRELSRLTGVPDSTIRAWKSRGKLSPDLWVDNDGSTLWKQSAIAVIQAIQGNAPIADTVTPIATGSDAAANLDAVECMIAELLADDALPEIESKVNRDRITQKALKIVASRIASKLRASNLEQWTLTNEHLVFSQAGVCGELPPSSEVTDHA